MYKRVSLAMAALAVGITCLAASNASAATLYTNAAHTTPVAVNSTFNATTLAEPKLYSVQWFVGGSLWQACGTASYGFKVTQNSGGVFKAEVTSSSFSPGCLATAAPIGRSGGTLQISGGSAVNGSNTAWSSSTISGVSWTQAGKLFTASYTSATGSPPANGVFAQQPTAAKAPVSLVLDHAGTWTGEVSGQFSAAYTLTGGASGWSLG